MQALEEYIANMENRSAIEVVNGEDIWTQLRQKDNDLQLAAELGKALLEKNEELKKQLDATIEEYSKKLEVLFSRGRFFCFNSRRGFLSETEFVRVAYFATVIILDRFL